MTTTPDVNPSVDATTVNDWQRVFDSDEQHRFFYGTSRGDQARVDIVGHQNADGTVPGRSIVLDGADVVNPAGARQLARHLIAAADEIERLAEAQR
jgi:hypothetical protein